MPIRPPQSSSPDKGLIGLSCDSPAVVSQGHFIVFEGIDGSGTTTQSHLLASYLSEAGLPVILTREPGGTPIAEKIRELVLDPSLEGISPTGELFLYAASRSQHVEEVILPSLNRRDVVICDRYIASSLAYQGYGRGLDLEVIEQVNRSAVGGCLPDATIYLLLPIEVAWARLRRRNTADRLEQTGMALQEKVARGYQEIAERDPVGLVFDAQLEMDQLAKEIRNALRERLPWFPEEKK